METSMLVGVVAEILISFWGMPVLAEQLNSLTPPGINERNLCRLQEGMSRDEIIAILGSNPKGGWYVSPVENIEYWANQRQGASIQFFGIHASKGTITLRNGKQQPIRTQPTSWNLRIQEAFWLIDDGILAVLGPPKRGFSVANTEPSLWGYQVKRPRPHIVSPPPLVGFGVGFGFGSRGNVRQNVPRW